MSDGHAPVVGPGGTQDGLAQIAERLAVISPQYLRANGQAMRWIWAPGV
jgi:hypothetical protein